MYHNYPIFMLGLLKVTSMLDYEHTIQYNLTVLIQDSTLLSNESVLTINVEDVNEPPVFTKPTSDQSNYVYHL